MFAGPSLARFDSGPCRSHFHYNRAIPSQPGLKGKCERGITVHNLMNLLEPCVYAYTRVVRLLYVTAFSCQDRSNMFYFLYKPRLEQQASLLLRAKQLSPAILLLVSCENSSSAPTRNPLPLRSPRRQQKKDG